MQPSQASSRTDPAPAGGAILVYILRHLGSNDKATPEGLPQQLAPPLARCVFAGARHLAR
jgi:hypothetical protein